MRWLGELSALTAASILAAAITDQWLIGASLPVIWAVWRFMRLEGGPPVLAFALTFNWTQAVIGLYYHAITGRLPVGMTAERYPEMVVINLACVLLWVAGIRLGDSFASQRLPERPSLETSLSWTTLLLFYFVLLAFRSTLRDFTWLELRQGLRAITYIRFALLFVILRRLVASERYGVAALFAATEIALGLTGFFAEFREPIFIAAIVLAERFDYRRSRHWIALTTIGATAIASGILWMGIRSALRQDYESRANSSTTERLGFTADQAESWLVADKEAQLKSADTFVNRVWDVYYPSLALARVPAVVPHTNGALLWSAVQHVLTPRILVPDKDPIESDSLQVRRYAGIFVAGPEKKTTIAFGYPIQGYIDFGIPGLFVPVLLYAMFVGAAYRFFLRMIRHRELAVAVVTVIFWMSLYTMSRSWPRLLGLSLTYMAYLGGITILLDRYLLSNTASVDELAAVEGR